MTPENDKKLVEACPNLFKGRWGEALDSSMHWGFECRDGWFELIFELSKKIEAIIKTLPDGAEYYAIQVKEKFGGLRFYMSGETEEMRHLIGEAEEVSQITCEECGGVGTLHTDGWWRTHCPRHEEEYLARKTLMAKNFK